MKAKRTETRKGAASIYIVIFTTTLLGIIALSFVRIMLAESLRTTNYSLSQSAYNSALAGVEDAKIVLLRYQSCINKGTYVSGGGKSASCDQIYSLFGNQNAAYKTSQDCSVVGKILHSSQSNLDKETLIQTQDNVDTGTIDQAYTCVKISTYTEDFLATLNSKNPTKLIPLRSDSPETQKRINRIQIQWFDSQNYDDVSNSDGNIKAGFSGFWKSGSNSDLTGKLVYNKGVYNSGSSTAADYGNAFTSDPVVPPVIQATVIQSANSFTMDQFYASEGAGNTSRTNRGTLMLRPTSSKDATLLSNRQVSTAADGNHSNVLPQNSIAYSANKSFNTPMDVVCDPGHPDQWGTYACKADFYLPAPLGSSYTDGHASERNMATSFLVVNLPYGGPQTDISAKMYSCIDPQKPINATIATAGGAVNCEIIYFANVQPMVDSTGRANDLFRRVESRIELADTNFPIANYALAMTDPANTNGIVKDFYVTNNCSYSSSWFDTTTKQIKNKKGGTDAHGELGANQVTCANSKKNNTDTPGNGNGE